MWSVNPAAMAGGWAYQRLAEPVPWVGRGYSGGWRKLAWDKQKLQASATSQC